MSTPIPLDERERLINEGTRRLRAGGIEHPRAEARQLLSAAAENPAATERTSAVYDAWLERRVRREPFAHIVQRREFWSLEFKVTPATLVPRPDSETLVDAALAWSRTAGAVRNILDLGTGSGCLLLSVLTELESAVGVGVDVSADAIAVAAANAGALGLSDRVRFICDDWARISMAGDIFDLIIANPPYIPTAEIENLMAEVRNFEPRSALDGGSDGLDAYRRLAPLIESLLAPGGAAFLEIGPGQSEPIADLMAAHGLHTIATKLDLGGHLRVLAFARR
jgi:release factor glutamine methyltransferase